MRKSNFAQQLSVAARFSASPEACTMYSVQATTLQLAHDPEREEAMPSKHPQAPATAVEARASATLSETAQNATNPLSIVSPSARDIVSVPSIPTSVRVPASSRDLASVCYQATIHRAACDITCAVPHSIHNPNCVPPASNHDTASSPCSICDSLVSPPVSPPASPSLPASVSASPRIPS